LLQKNYRELAALNENLESIINEKTEKIKEKNKHLADIAYANAHTIRGPLARILGLLNLSKLEPGNSEFYLSKICDEATQMDKTLFAVTRRIETNIHK
jgi:signal transduction histidine kinase